MPRWYAGFLCFGKANVVVQQVGNAVRNMELAAFIPVMRTQKNPSKTGFYIFLGIESNTAGEFPKEMQQLLGLPLFQGKTPGAFTLEDIRKMVGTELDTHEYAQRIPFVATRSTDLLDNPFGHDGIVSLSDETADRIVESSHRFDRLLLWLSAVGDGTWAAFCGICQQLELAPRPSHIMRRLRLLGHIETSRDGNHWSVAPAVLVQPPALDCADIYILAGERSEIMLERLSAAAASVEVMPQPDGMAPTTIRFHLQCPSTLAPGGEISAASCDVRIGGRVAEELACALPTMEEWMDSLPTVYGIHPSTHRVKQFDTANDVFVDTVFDNRTGFYELWPREQLAASGALHLFYDRPTDRWVRGDWYGLRFLAKRATGQGCRVVFQASTSQAALERSWRWPELYERALVLASGRLPSDSDVLTYSGVSVDLLNTLEAKLQLRCERA